MKFSKSIYILCLLMLWLGALNGYGQTPDEPTTIRGKITDQNNVPLPGVNLSIQESKDHKSVNTDAEGKFTISCNTSDVFVIKMEGYLTLTKSAVEIDNTTTMLAKVLIDAGDDDNVYIPFGVRKRRQVSATVSTIKGDDLPQLPSSSLNNVFSGRLPGLYIYAFGSQQPGYDVSAFMVRGRSSYNNNQDPLVLVDGVERDFRYMDLNEVESVSVLKDAATLAWYGMYAANGVIYVKTKRGSAIKTSVTFDAQGGAATPMQLTKNIDSYTYASLYNQAQINSGNPATYNAATLAAYQDPTSDPYKYPNNNFVRDYTRNISPTERFVATVTGGNAFVKFFTLLSYYNQGGFYKGSNNPQYDASTNFDKYNLRTNLDLHVNKNLDVSLDIGGRITHLRFPQVGTSGFLTTIYSTPPNAFPVLNADGTYGGTSLFQKSNPLAMMNAAGVSTDLTRNMMAGINAKQKLNGILNGLSLNLFYSYDVYGSYRSGFDQSYEVYEQSATTPGTYTRYGTASVVNYSSNTFSGNVRKNELWGGFDYDQNFGKHGVNITTRVERASTATFSLIDTRRESWANRISYNYNQRYFVDMIGTFYGSENFIPSDRWGFFPAASAGWIISDESFMKNIKFLDFLKLRGSYGLVGNDALTSLTRRFQYLTTYNRSTTGYNFGTSYTGVGGTGEYALGNPDLTWEKAYKTSVGFDTKMFKQKLSISADYFYEDRKDLLTNSLLPSILGQTLVQVNEGEAEYRGFEASFNYNQKFGKVNFNLYGNFTYNVSKILAINEGAGLPDYQKQIGHPITSVTLTQGGGYTRNFLLSDGIFQSQAQIDASPQQLFSKNVRPGDIKYKDINGDGVINNLDFVTTDYNFVPNSFFGFGSSASYKNFDVSVFFQGIKGRTISIQNIINSGNANNGYINQFSTDAWTPSNPGAPFPRLIVADRGNNTQNSDFWLRSGDYIRLKNAEIGYSLPQAVVKRMRLSQLRFYISGTNLLTFDKLGGLPFDPEAPEAGYNSTNQANYPYMRIYSFGLNLKF